MSFFNITKGLDTAKAYFTPTAIFDENKLSKVAKERKIFPQSETMAHLQKHLRTWLRANNTVRLTYATGAVPGSSPFVNVRRHRRKDRSGNYYFPRYFYLLDLRDAYKNVRIKMLASILSTFEVELFLKEEELESFLTRFCSCEEGGIAVGASASPDLFNIYCGVLLDSHLGKVCEGMGITYTRYLDDLTFSSNKPIGRKLRKGIRMVIKKAGFTVSENKTRVYDLTKGPVTINGIGIRINGDIFTPRSFTDGLRGMLHLALSGRGNDIPSALLRGKIALFYQTLRAKGRTPNKTELKIDTLATRYLVFQKQLKKARL